MLNILPSKKEFIESTTAGEIHPLYAELPYMSPGEVYESIGSRRSFLLESIKGPENISRYSFIGSDPILMFRVKKGVITIDGVTALGSAVKGEHRGVSPLRRLKDLLTAYRTVPAGNLPPFTGGAVGLLSYDFVHYFEKLPLTAEDDLQIPDAHFMFVDTVVAIDHRQEKTFLITSPGAREAVLKQSAHNIDWSENYDAACIRLTGLYERITSRTPEHATVPVERTVPIAIHHEMGKEAYTNIVKRAKEYIRAGDIFQANLSQRVSANIGDTSPWQIYKILSGINPSPFAAYLDMGEYVIASSSPERLVKVSGSTVETRPIAGTRPRGRNAEDDKMLRADLLLNEKERAEHLMLIDLERNDLGKISDYSTVEVDELMITEDYSHVIHIVSNVRGTLAEGKDCFDAIRATFPGGTITGVPKVRCMEIIDELEPVVRGPYTGSAGYISFTGDMDLNIIIRTFVIKDSTAYVQAGAGIVADSDPEKEYYETLKKAEALLKTLEML
jgi:anthranilate/para-aminobenzoate synthase component I